MIKNDFLYVKCQEDELRTEMPLFHKYLLRMIPYRLICFLDISIINCYVDLFLILVPNCLGFQLLLVPLKMEHQRTGSN